MEEHNLRDENRTEDIENDVLQEQMESGEKSYSFLNEHVKTDRKSFLSRLKPGQAAAVGLIVGMVVCLAIYVFSPVIKERLKPAPAQVGQITIPEDQPEDQANVEPIEEPAKLDADDYAEMISEMNEVAASAKSSMVILHITQEEETSEETAQEGSFVSGVIVAKTAQEILILHPDFILDEGEPVSITFGNGDILKSSLKKRDAVTGLAVSSVKTADMNQELQDYYAVATLGNSYAVAVGSPVLLLGQLFGSEQDQAYGVVVSKEKDYTREDSSYSVMSSDVTGGNESSGVFLNLDGEVVGFVIPEQDEERELSIRAYSISEIKKVIENLSNGESIPYVGIVGIDVTESEASEYDLNQGVYISKVTLDSPAMAAGLLNGDIIQEVDGKSITTMTSFRSVLLGHASGDTMEIKVKRPGKNGYISIKMTVTLGSKQSN